VHIGLRSRLMTGDDYINAFVPQCGGYGAANASGAAHD